MSEIAAIGIDVGGTKIAGGVVRFPGGGRSTARVAPTGAERGGRAVLDLVVDLARRLAEGSASSGGKVSAIGLGICELVDRSGDLASANCIDWRDLPVREALSDIAPVVIEADVRAAAVAESWFGAGRPFRNFLYVNIGTGISCCLMLDGEPYLGSRGLTGTMASSPFAVPCEHCGRTSQRSLEEIASGHGMAARLRTDGKPASTGREVLEAARDGDPQARRIVESAGEALESYVGLLVSTLDPEAVVVGGGLGSSEGPYWDGFIASTRSHIWSDLHRGLPILRAKTGADAGWMGAAACAVKMSQPQTGRSP